MAAGFFDVKRSNVSVNENKVYLIFDYTRVVMYIMMITIKIYFSTVYNIMYNVYYTLPDGNNIIL